MFASCISLHEGDAVVDVGVDRASLIGDIAWRNNCGATAADAGGGSWAAAAAAGGPHLGPLHRMPARGGGPLGI